jgi:hypothetical protein
MLSKKKVRELREDAGSVDTIEMSQDTAVALLDGYIMLQKIVALVFGMDSMDMGLRTDVNTDRWEELEWLVIKVLQEHPGEEEGQNG